MKLFCDEEPKVGARIRAVVIDQQEGLLRLEGKYLVSAPWLTSEVVSEIKYIETKYNHGYPLSNSSLWEYMEPWEYAP